MSQEKNKKIIDKNIKTIELAGTSYIGPDRRLVVKPEVLEAMDKERLRKRKLSLNDPIRLLGIEIDESLLQALTSLRELYKYVRSFCKKNSMDFPEEDRLMLEFLQKTCTNMSTNLMHKKDRMLHPEIYSDINKRYDKFKRGRRKNIDE